MLSLNVGACQMCHMRDVEIRFPSLFLSSSSSPCHRHITELITDTCNIPIKVLPLISSQHSNYEPGKQSMVYFIWNGLAMNLDKIVLTVMRFKKTINQTLWSLLADWGQLKRRRGTFSLQRVKILQVNCEAQLCLGRTAAAVSRNSS